MPLSEIFALRKRFGLSIRCIGLAWACACVMTGTPALAQSHHQHEESREAPRRATQYRGLQFRTGTSSPEAQRLFDQGLLMLYAFNQGPALQAFTHAAHMDPDMPMAYWGIAMAEGPYYNSPFTAERNARGHAAISQAKQRIAHASAREAAYIHALATRYSDAQEPDLLRQEQQYSAAMQQLSDRYPDDLDAAVLYAESRMLLNPWRLWEENGVPGQGTSAILDVLESVLGRSPDHVGANHLYIHAVEASPQPQRALASAMRLEALRLDAGHLAHMPGHIYLRVGDYEGVVRSNLLAVASDEAFAEAEGGQSMRQLGYAMHNLEFVVVGYTELGDWEVADRTSRTFHDMARVRVADAPERSALLARRTATLLRFERWQEVLGLPLPAPAYQTARAFHHYAQGVAHAAQGRISDARRAQRRFASVLAEVPPDADFRGNAAAHVLGIAGHVLDARIAMAQGRLDAAAASLQLGIALQDGLRYDEQPSWDFPLRELLGTALLQGGQPVQAEAVYRENLRRLPRHPRSLDGLRRSLLAQGRTDEAELVGQPLR